MSSPVSSSASGPSPSPSRKPFVVIVMPAYNAAKTLEDTFRRIPEGYYDEVIVVDDFSRDDTTELAKRLNLKAIRHPHNVGYGGDDETNRMADLRDAGDIAVVAHPGGDGKPTTKPLRVQPIHASRTDIEPGSTLLD